MKPLFCHALLASLLLTASTSTACDADVLRLNYRKNTTTRPAAKPATTAPKNSDALQKSTASMASLSASTRLEPR